MSIGAKSSQYLEMKIQTATPEMLTAMLYEGAIRFLKQAVNSIDKKDWHDVNANIVRAQDIVAELNVTLDRSRGGDIAKNLATIYDYVNRRLIEANIKKDAGYINDCIGILSSLNSAWSEVVKKAREGAKVAT